jgi:hypothetical protein
MSKRNLLENIKTDIKAYGKCAALNNYEASRKEFSKIVDKAITEKSLQEYLEKHPLLLLNAGLRLFFPFGIRRCALFSKSRFAERYIVDFSFVHVDSTGANWFFIELERADVNLFNKKGDMSRHLNHAFRQITDWQAWIKDNKAYAQDILGGLQNSAGIKKETNFSTDPNFVIIIGRRKMLNEETIRRRNELCNNHPRLKIITYDRLLELIDLFNGKQQ